MKNILHEFFHTLGILCQMRCELHVLHMEVARPCKNAHCYQMHSHVYGITAVDIILYAQTTFSGACLMLGSCHTDLQVYNIIGSSFLHRT